MFSRNGPASLPTPAGGFPRMDTLSFPSNAQDVHGTSTGLGSVNRDPRHSTEDDKELARGEKCVS